MNSIKPHSKHSSDSMDDKIQSYLEPVRKASFDGKYEAVVAWYRRVDGAKKERKKRRGLDLRNPFFGGIRLKAIVFAGLALTLYLFIPWPKEKIVGHLMYMSMEMNSERSRQKSIDLEFPPFQTVFSHKAIEGKTYAVLLLPAEGGNQATSFLKRVESDEAVELIESIEFKEEEELPSIVLFISDVNTWISGQSKFKRAIERRKFHNLAAPYVSKWLGTKSKKYELTSVYLDDAVRFSLVPTSDKIYKSESDKLFMLYNRLKIVISMLEIGQGSSMIKASEILSRYRASLEIVMANDFQSRAAAGGGG